MIKYCGWLDSDTLTKGENDGGVYKLAKKVKIKDSETCSTLTTARPREDGYISFEIDKDFGDVAFVGLGYCNEDPKDKSSVVQVLWLMTEREANEDLKCGYQGDFDCYYPVTKENCAILQRFIRRKDVNAPELCVNKEDVGTVARPEAREYKLKKFDLILDARTYFDVKGLIPLSWDYVPIFYGDLLVGYGCGNEFRIFGSFSNEVCLRVKASYDKKRFEYDHRKIPP